MRGKLSFVFHLISAWIISVAIVTTIAGCAGDKFFDQVSNLSNALSGYIAVSTVASQSGTTLTGPGMVALFDPDGNFVRTLADYFSEGAYGSGLGILGSTLYVSVISTDRIELINPSTGQNFLDVSHAGLVSNPLRQMTVDTSGNIYIPEWNTGSGQIEKFDTAHGRVGNPFIPTTTGSCTMQNPWSIAYIPSTDQIVVTNSGAGRLLFYNASTGTCAASVTDAAFGSTTTAVAYHPQTNKLLTARVGNEAIYQSTVTGGSPAVAYLNTSRVTDPYAIAVDSDGYVYIGSAATDTVEKFSFDGTTLTPIDSIIGPNAFSQNPVAIKVFP